MRQRIARSELYLKVWQFSTASVAKQLGITANELRKTCRKHNIPLPGPDHWKQQSGGKPAPVPPVSLTDGPDPVLIGRETDILLAPSPAIPSIADRGASRGPLEAFYAMRLDLSHIVGNVIHLAQVPN